MEWIEYLKIYLMSLGVFCILFVIQGDAVNLKDVLGHLAFFGGYMLWKASFFLYKNRKSNNQ